MKILLKQYIILVYSSVFLVSCATTDAGPDLGRDLDGRGSDCISIRTIRDYRPLDRSSLIIEGAGNRLYYVTLVISSFELRGSHQIRVESRDDWLCPYGGDSLIFDSFGNNRISIRGISRLTPEQADELLYKHGKKERPAQEDQASPGIEGAEIEDIGETPDEQPGQTPPESNGAKVEELGQAD
jgi:hypothetical protein